MSAVTAFVNDFANWSCPKARDSVTNRACASCSIAEKTRRARTCETSWSICTCSIDVTVVGADTALVDVDTWVVADRPQESRGTCTYCITRKRWSCRANAHESSVQVDALGCGMAVVCANAAFVDGQACSDRCRVVIKNRLLSKITKAFSTIIYGIHASNIWVIAQISRCTLVYIHKLFKPWTWERVLMTQDS